jgi:hypothetical protein
MADTITRNIVDDDLQENDDNEDSVPMDDEAFEKIEATLGTGDKRVMLVTKPITFNQMLKMLHK